MEVGVKTLTFVNIGSHYGRTIGTVGVVQTMWGWNGTRQGMAAAVEPGV